MRLSLWLALAALVLAIASAPFASALHEDEYGSDFFLRDHIGVPTRSVLQPDGTLLALTDSHVVAAVAPNSGAVRWRRVLPEAEVPLALAAHQKAVLTVSAAANATVLRLWFADQGDLIWERSFTASAHSNAACPVASVAAAFTGADADGDGVSEIALLCGATVRTLSGLTGATLATTVATGSAAAISTPGKSSVAVCAASALAVLPGGVVAAVCAAPAASALTVAYFSAPGATSASASELSAPAATVTVALPGPVSALAASAALLTVATADGAVLTVTLPATLAAATAAAAAKSLTAAPAPLPTAFKTSGSVTVTAASPVSGTVLVSHPSAGVVALSFSAAAAVTVTATVGPGGVICGVSDSSAAAPLRAFLPPSAADAAPLLQPAPAPAAPVVLPAWAAGRGAVHSCRAGPGARVAAVFADGSAALLSLSLPTVAGAGAGVAALWVREEGLAEIELIKIAPLPSETGLLGAAAAAGARPLLAAPAWLIALLPAALRPSASSGSNSGSSATMGGAGDRKDRFAVPPSGAPSKPAHRDAFGSRQAMVAVTRRGLAVGLASDSGALLWRRYLFAASACDARAVLMATSTPTGTAAGTAVSSSAATVTVSRAQATMWGPNDMVLSLAASFSSAAAQNTAVPSTAESASSTVTVGLAVRLAPWTGALLPAPVLAAAPAPAATAASAPGPAAAAAKLISARACPAFLPLPLLPTTLAAIPEPDSHHAPAAAAADGAPAAVAGVASATGVAAALSGAVARALQAAVALSSPAAAPLTALPSVLFVADASHASDAFLPENNSNKVGSAMRDEGLPVAVVARPDSGVTAARALALLAVPVALTVADRPRGVVSSWSLSAASVAATAAADKSSKGVLCARALPTWGHSVGRGASLAAVAAADAGERIGSAVRVVGDHRGALTKAVDRELLVLAVAAPAGVEVRLLAAATGETRDAWTLAGLAPPLLLAVAENSVTVAGWAPARGRHEVMVIDSYLNNNNNNIANSTGSSGDVVALTQTFTLPHAPRAWVATSTGRGLTAKDLVLATEAGRVIPLSRSLLDARRPLAPTTEDREEGLVPYAPALVVPPAHWLSLNHTLPRARMVVSAPAALESVSLVAVAGLDLYLRRAAPAGLFDVLADSFDAPFLLLTVLAVAAATALAWARVSAKAEEKEWR